MRWTIKRDASTRSPYQSVDTKGKDLLMNPFTNKGPAFTEDERDALDLHGLLPPAVCTISQQLERTYESYLAKSDPLEKYIYLKSLHDRNATLFYRLLEEHIEEMMPIVYTPTVGEACRKFSHIYRKPQGLYISYDHRDQIERILRNTPCERPTIMVVTDGERILGLGDQGAGGMGISIGKLCLYTLCAAIPPYSTLPILLDVGTNNAHRLQDPLYLGLRHNRIRGAQYQAFIDAFVAAVQKVFPHILLQWEDLLKENAMRQLHRYRTQICSFNDDIQGTAAVLLAGIFSGLRITGEALSDQHIVIAGAGASAQGIADLLIAAMHDAGLSLAKARDRIWTTDSQGLVVETRTPLDTFKKKHARAAGDIAHFACCNRDRITLEETIANVHPTILIGCSGAPSLFTESIIRSMAGHVSRPMIFPLSNPTSKEECTPEDALCWSDGRAIIATGSPFAPVTCQGIRHEIGQCNNAYIFPGVGLGVTTAEIRRISDGMFFAASKTLASLVTEHRLQMGSLFPPLTMIRDCSHAIACAVIRQGVTEGLAEPGMLDDLEARVKSAMWVSEYLPVRYEP
ncbi:MAG: NAD-dependent malic enzyme [Deltaproteobacteria bacterium]|nr:NAD-dependent malic enzyme [Deltaproteobacteria bacterium]